MMLQRSLRAKALSQVHAPALVCVSLTLTRRGFASRTRVWQLQSASLEAARRLVNPSAATPATGPAGEVPPADPRVEWREYWSVADDMPYYHNMKTHQVTWSIPSGFTTRFPTFHSHNSDLKVDVDGRVTYVREAAAPGDAAPGEEGAATVEGTSSAKPLSLKQKLALYGSGGLVLYLIIHNACLFCVFVSIYFLGVDLVGVARSYGFNIKSSSKADGETATSSPSRPGFFSTFITAVLLNKLTVPLQLTLTLLLAPRFVPKLQPFANRMAPIVRRWMPVNPFASKKGMSRKH